MMDHKQRLASYVQAFGDGLRAQGIKNIVICPGSRSTPLTVMFEEQEDMKVWMHVDERSAAFFALGMAKAEKQPTALVCSSGTAAANFYPAVIEAYQSRLPLLIFTADRPHELRDVGAPQAINQIQLYGDYVKWFMDMALPEADVSMLDYAYTAAVRAVMTAVGAPQGPVHLNFPFREPLVPDALTLSRHTKQLNPLVTPSAYQRGGRCLTTEQKVYIAQCLQQSQRGLIVCGTADFSADVTAMTQLAAQYGFPILADPLSGLRSGQHDKTWVIDSYDAFLREDKVVQSLRPDVVIRFGPIPVSKALKQYIEYDRHVPHIVVDEQEGWQDPSHLTSLMVHTRTSDFCEALTDDQPHAVSDDREQWRQTWYNLNERTKTVVQQYLDEQMTEGGIYRTLLTSCLPEGAHLFVGNSMPIRDLDTFFFTNDQQVTTYANRGANGIDGVTSTALGVSTTASPLVLVTGDLSFYHDMNGLLAGKYHHLSVTIIVVNNDGGGIFSFLPQSSSVASFEKLFGTPLGLDFAKAVDLYGGTYSRVENWRDFRQQVTTSLQTEGMQVIEVKTDRTANIQWHEKIRKAISREIAALSLPSLG